jgi:two-component system, chemotaxis family, protein-glutamate methylesterase/glutaminase
LTRPRVLVVDDSAFARKVIREVLSDDPRIEVVGFARDGLDALEKIQELSPDVVTLDLVMPDLDGAGVLAALAQQPNPPRVVIVTMSDAESPLAVAALQAGAFDLVHKPTALATDRLYELREELVGKVLAAAAAPGPIPAAIPQVHAGRERPVTRRIVVIATSTGGPRALTLLFAALRGTFPVPIVTVVHMPPGFTQGLASRLDSDSELTIREAEEGLVVAPGTMAVGRAGLHVRIRERADGACVLTLGAAPISTLHRPSADVLFSSAAETYGANVLAVVLTGMGSDGLEGARAVRNAGGRVIVEHASSCVVHGMPRVVAEAGLADAVVPLEGMAAAILENL